MTVSYNGSNSKLDMVVIGPTGVFIIETKNMCGTIYGNCESPMWTQQKTGAWNAIYEDII